MTAATTPIAVERPPLVMAQITASGGTPAACPVDGTVFDARKSYAGHRSNRARRYCSDSCRLEARAAYSRARYAAAGSTGVRRMRAEEARGQLPIPGAGELPEPGPRADPFA